MQLGEPGSCEELPQRITERLHTLKPALDSATSCCESDSWGDEQWAAWEAELAALLPDPDAFQAHSLRQQYPIWEHLLRLGKRSKMGEVVLRRLKEGCSFDFVRPSSDGQKQHPRWKQNMERVCRHIAQVYGPDAVEHFIAADRPQPIHLPNHRSFEENGEFGRDAVAKLAACNAIKRWPFPQPPRVVLPLGVALAEGRKPRLVLDGGYTNLFCRYQSFPYEQLPDLTAYLEQGFHGSSTDATSGFYHWSLHPDCWEYAAIFVDGEYYGFTVPAFGLVSLQIQSRPHSFACIGG